MKKSLLALAIIAASTTATAATVYDKDGTSLAVGGRVQAVVYNGKADAAEIAEHDAGLVNSARLNIEGNTKVNDYVSAFAFSEWNMADGNKSATGDSINTREQYVGADFGDFGKILVGKTYDAHQLRQCIRRRVVQRIVECGGLVVVIVTHQIIQVGIVVRHQRFAVRCVLLVHVDILDLAIHRLYRRRQAV